MAKTGAGMSVHCGFRGAVACFLAVYTFVGSASSRASAQAGAAQQSGMISALMLSDLHLDPFHDPAKVPQLVKAPVEQWESILGSPDSPTQDADFTAVQQTCKAKKLTDSPMRSCEAACKQRRRRRPTRNLWR
jgi:sphingomyelin phosphodiesterase acid-like 3